MTVVVFLLLLLGAVPIALVLALTAMWYIQASGNTVLFDSYPQQLFSAIESYGLLAIPLFMLAGELMNEGGLTKRLIALARILVGGFRGGLAYINLVANMMMAAIIGSAASQIAIMSRAMVPAMEQEGYDTPYSAAITAAGGLLSPISPPCCSCYLGSWLRCPLQRCLLQGCYQGFCWAQVFLWSSLWWGWCSSTRKGSGRAVNKRCMMRYGGCPHC